MPFTLEAREPIGTPPTWAVLQRRLVDANSLRVDLPPGAQIKLDLGMKRFVHEPGLVLPF